jgi:dihydrofolate reductase
MSKVIAFESITLDGVMQAPGRPDEDRRGGFKHGGWAAPYSDADLGKAAGESMATTGGLLLGRRTYEDLYGFWPKQKDNPYTEMLNKAKKYVVSSTLKEPLPWENSTLVKGDAAKAVAELRKKPGKDLVMLGSGKLARSLMQKHLIDEYVLLIHPLVLGSGQRLFTDDGELSRFKLVDTKTTSKGVVMATYRNGA